MKYQAYPEYKNSGFEWLGKVPEMWNVVQLKRVVDSVKTGGTPLKADETHFEINGFNWFTPSDFFYNNLFLNNAGRTLSAVGKSEVKIFPPETVMMVSIGATIGKVAISSDYSSCNQQVNAIICSKFLKPFYCCYYLKANKNYIINSGKFTTLPIINQEDTKSLIIVLPSLQEQTIIANFLDRETQRIDALVEEKKDFIKLLKEKRQTLISHTVTQGLDPTASMKDSGVDWLGEVPKHWQVKKIKHLFQIRKRIAGKLGFPVLSITQKGIKVKDTVTGTGQLSMDYSKYQIVKVGDFAMNHMDLLTGYVDLSLFHGVTSPDYRVFTLTDSGSVDRYYLYLMQMGYKDKIFFAYGQGVANIGRWRFQTEAFSNFKIPYPNKKEQQEIVDFLDRQMTKLDSLTEETQTSIDLLKEHRSALISAAVTGKIDVRSLA